MKLAQVAALAAALVAAGCDRAATEERARRATADVREAAARAGDRLADGWLATKIQARYFADEDVKARYIDVSARDGVVTLSGRVDAQHAREEAVQIARSTDGVRQVIDRLAVRPADAAGGAPGRLDSSWITTQIQARYFADSIINGRDIDVAAQEGVVTLSGRVGSLSEKEQAVAIARGVEGVARVDDRLLIEPGEPSEAVATTGVASEDRAVTTRIQARYFLDDAVKARRIEVDARQGVVTLRGEVASDDERAQALLLARTTEGVDRVEDHLTVDASLDAPAAAAPGATGMSPSARAEDAALAERVRSRLAADRQLRTGSIEVTAKDGVVLLEGQAPTAAAKQRALALARETEGVLQVVDRMTVGPRAR